MQVPDTIIVKAAAQKAVLANAKGALRSRSMHAELVFNLSGSKHVGRSSPAVASSASGVLMLKKRLHTQWTLLPNVTSILFIWNAVDGLRGNMTRSTFASH